MKALFIFNSDLVFISFLRSSDPAHHGLYDKAEYFQDAAKEQTDKLKITDMQAFTRPQTNSISDVFRTGNNGKP